MSVRLKLPGTQVVVFAPALAYAVVGGVACHAFDVRQGCLHHR